MKKQGIAENTLHEAAIEIRKGLIDASIGGCLYKKRIPTPGGGKRGGTRTILAYKEAGHIFFLHGFAKNEKDNISLKERKILSELGKLYLELDERQIKKAVNIGELMEVI